MPSYSYLARDPATGKEQRNSIEAPNKQSAVAALLAKNLVVVKIDEQAGGNGKSTGGAVTLADRVVFTRQLATMVDAGISMVQSLQALAEQTTNKIMRDVIKDVCYRVESGDNFSNALAKHPKIFDNLYTCMVDAGEKGGLLAEILSRLAGFLERTEKLRKKVKSAMMYPTMVSLVAIAITIFLLIKVVPVFGEIFSDFGAELPGPTQFVLSLSDFVKNSVIYLILAAGGLIWSWLKYIDTKPGRAFWDRTRIKLPIFGSLALKICLTRFTRTLASLIRSGVPILEVLSIVGNTCGNVVMKSAIDQAAGDIERGEAVAIALGKHTIFPKMLIRMLTAGEQTGKMDDMLERVADFYDEEVETTLNGLTSLIEPLLIVFLGIVIGGMVIAMFMPIFKMSQIING